MSNPMLSGTVWEGKKLPGQNELPSDDGEPLETFFHWVQPHLLAGTLFEHWSDRQFFVAGNMFVYFSEHQIKKNDFRGPDLFVVLDTERKPRKSWVVWEERGLLPDVVVEITSESTEHIDRGIKMRIYAKVWRTAAYLIFDPETERLDAYQLDADRLEYLPIPENERGDFPLPVMGLSVGLRRTQYFDFDRPFVRWIDAAGNPLSTGSELVQVERAQRQNEHTRAEQERARAEQERARAEQERARAEQAEAERNQALDRARELEAELHALMAQAKRRE